MDFFEQLIQQLINGISLGSIYALIALGYTMVYGILGIINFSHGEVFMIGAMVAMTVTTLLVKAGLGPVLALLIATLAAISAFA